MTRTARVAFNLPARHSGGCASVTCAVVRLGDRVAMKTLLMSALCVLAVTAQAADTALPQVSIETSHGTIIAELWPQAAPQTVTNFIALATGQRTWSDPATGEDRVNQPFYDGLTFHRVIPEFYDPRRMPSR